MKGSSLLQGKICRFESAKKGVLMGRLRHYWLFAVVSGLFFLPLSPTSYAGQNAAYGSSPCYALYFSQASQLAQTSPAALIDGDLLQGWVTLGNNAGATVSWTMSGTVQFQTVGRIEGTLASDGTACIQLLCDMWCGSTFATTGHMAIQGGGRSLRLWGPLTLTGANCWQAGTSNLFVDGQWNTVTLDGANALRLDSGVSVTLSNMNLVLSNPLPFSLADHSSILTLSNVNVIFNVASGGNYKFDSVGGNHGQLYIAGDVLLGGVGASAPTTFSYNSNYTLGIMQGGQLIIGDGVNFSYDSATSNCLVMADATSRLRFDNSSLVVPSGVGLQALKGLITFDNLCHVINTGATSSTGGVVFGDGSTSGNNVDVRLLSGATVVVDGYVQYNHS